MKESMLSFEEKNMILVTASKYSLDITCKRSANTVLLIYLGTKLINGCYGNRNIKWLNVLNCTRKSSFWVKIVQFMYLCFIYHGTMVTGTWMAPDPNFYSTINNYWAKNVQWLCLCIRNHGTSKSKRLLYNSKKKMGRLVYINCWQLTKIMLFFNMFCTKTRNVITI